MWEAFYVWNNPFFLIYPKLTGAQDYTMIKQMVIISTQVNPKTNVSVAHNFVFKFKAGTKETRYKLGPKFRVWTQ